MTTYRVRFRSKDGWYTFVDVDAESVGGARRAARVHVESERGEGWTIVEVYVPDVPLRTRAGEKRP